MKLNLSKVDKALFFQALYEVIAFFAVLAFVYFVFSNVNKEIKKIEDRVQGETKP